MHVLYSVLFGEFYTRNRRNHKSPKENGAFLVEVVEPVRQKWCDGKKGFIDPNAILFDISLPLSRIPYFCFYPPPSYISIHARIHSYPIYINTSYNNSLADQLSMAALTLQIINKLFRIMWKISLFPMGRRRLRWVRREGERKTRHKREKKGKKVCDFCCRLDKIAWIVLTAHIPSSAEQSKGYTEYHFSRFNITLFPMASLPLFRVLRSWLSLSLYVHSYGARRAYPRQQLAMYSMCVLWAIQRSRRTST